MRIGAKNQSQYPWYLQPFFWNQKRKYGALLDAALLWARSPRLFLGVALLYGMIDRKNSPLSPVLRSLVAVLVSQINSCTFCIDLNSAVLLKRGVPQAKVDALSSWRESNLFDEAESAALNYADAVTRYDRGVDNQLFAELQRHFQTDVIVELTGLIAFQNLSSKFNSALAVPPHGFCHLTNDNDRKIGK